MTLLNQIRLIVDEPSGPKFWPNQQLYDAANEASIEVLGSGQFEITTLTTTATTSIVAIPSELMIPKFVLNTNNNEIPKTTLAELERESPNWGTATGTAPIAFVELDLNNILIYPIVSTAVSLKFVGVPYPVEVTTGVEDFTSDDQITLAAKFYAGSILMDATRPDLSEAYRVEGEQLMPLILRQWRNQQSHLFRALKPANEIDGRRTGNLNTIRRLGGLLQ